MRPGADLPPNLGDDLFGRIRIQYVIPFILLLARSRRPLYIDVVSVLDWMLCPAAQPAEPWCEPFGDAAVRVPKPKPVSCALSVLRYALWRVGRWHDGCGLV